MYAIRAGVFLVRNIGIWIVLLAFGNTLFPSDLLHCAEINKKVLICGVCKNISAAVPNTIENMEKLGSKFVDYRVIIYENNSTDGTERLLNEWAHRSEKVYFLSETLTQEKLPSTREGGIARARNIVLSLVRDLPYTSYKYLIMVDLDFIDPWPIDEIVNSLKTEKDWDCIAANGIRNGSYYDRYAFRSCAWPVGPEFVGCRWWTDLYQNWFSLKEGDWLPVYSAFGGLAIYKTETIILFSYSSEVTDSLVKFYSMVFEKLGDQNPQINQYRQELNAQGLLTGGDAHGWLEKRITCCEHVTLHASMALQGHDKFYVNPNMKMLYQ